MLINSAYVNKEEMSDWGFRKLVWRQWEGKQVVSINIREYILRNQLQNSIQDRRKFCYLKTSICFIDEQELRGRGVKVFACLFQSLYAL